ncbi:F5/8 type C domain-containing protein [Niabella drilacis]|uniref:F5/8 type C domain-containing protein n=2 Tax=Niabella drilacis (strain DSM 25811 / CCM 8410 / CCUG 62505 / LMG 26954 / E90) TaxID=1285928 RepID=A0A1G7B430_NIADE|nr:F5/8 type C domain-containing protein [Niabella drilacis]
MMQRMKIFKKYMLFLVLPGILMISCRKSSPGISEDGTQNKGADGPSITIDTSIATIDASKFDKARVFPGLVCKEEPRVEVSLNMDLKYEYVAEFLRTSRPPVPQFSTGLYAAPGELVIIDIPSTEYSLSVQVGAWTDDLSFIANSLRDPVIITRNQLAPGRNYVRNLYGGPIYIIPARPVEQPVPIKFSNVVKSPDFVLGVTSNEDWKAAIAGSCVPFIELRSKNIVFVVPREYCLQYPIADPNALMSAWDNAILEDFYKWQGLEENPVDERDQAPLLPWRVVQDIQPARGYAHSGYPVVTYNDKGWFDEFTNLDALKKGGAWGVYHQLGHNNQQPLYWSWNSLAEATGFLFAFKAAHRNEVNDPLAWPPKNDKLAASMERAIAFAKDSTISVKLFNGSDERVNDPFARVTPFVQIIDKIPANWGFPGQKDGWAFITELYKKSRRANRISLSDQDKQDFFYETLCNYTKQNWKIFFQRWGIAISNISLGKMEDLPLMTQKIWEYNPITRTGGDDFFDPDFYAKSNWSILAFSSQEPNGEGPPNGLASAIIDGNINTFWHPQWQAAIGTVPHWITIDFGSRLKINGIQFVQRQTSGGFRKVKNLTLETSIDAVNWTTASGSPYALTTDNTPQTLAFSSTVTARYLRLSVPTIQDTYDQTAEGFCSMAEVDVIKP